MRIAIFHHLPSGGALKLVAQSARILAERGHTVWLFTFSSAEQEFAPWPLENEREVVPLSLKGLGMFRNYARATEQIAGRIAAWQPDVVWVEKCRLFGHPPVVAALRAAVQVPLILHTHEPLRVRAVEALAPVVPGPEGNGEPPPSFELSAADLVKKVTRLPAYLRVTRADQAAVAAATKVLTSSEFTREWLWRAYGVKATVLAPGVDTTFLKPDLEGPRIARVLSVGRLTPAKGHDFVIRALGLLPESIRPALDIACDEAPAEAKQALEDEGVRCGVALKIHHRASDEELRALYRGARAVLCAAYREPFGLAPPEAMACGTPVLAVREGGFAETVADGETGWLLPRVAERWTEPLTKLLTDDALAARMGRAGVARVRGVWSAEGWAERAAAATGLPL